MYDSGLFPSEEFSVAVVSVGNLSVGGTGKTPVAAWIARALTERGIKPGIVLRGYGGDETIVHQRLNAGVPVIVASDRARGIREAIAQGADVVILDDAFQHRRAARDADVLLVDADSWSGSPRLLPRRTVARAAPVRETREPRHHHAENCRQIDGRCRAARRRSGGAARSNRSRASRSERTP